MATKKQDVLALLDKAVGKKGPLRIPAYWMREVFLKTMDWAEGLTPKVDVPTKISQLENDVALATQSYVNSNMEIAGKTVNCMSDTYKTLYLTGVESSWSTVQPYINSNYYLSNNVFNCKDLVPISNNSGSIGTSSKKYNSVYATNVIASSLSGTLPWSNISGAPSIAKKVSELENDSDFVNKTYVDYQKTLLQKEIQNSKSNKTVIIKCDGFTDAEWGVEIDDEGNTSILENGLCYIKYKTDVEFHMYVSNTNAKFITAVDFSLSDHTLSAVSNIIRHSNCESIKLPNVWDSESSPDFGFTGLESPTVLDLSEVRLFNVSSNSTIKIGQNQLSAIDLMLGKYFFAFRGDNVTVDLSNANYWRNNTVVTSLVENTFDRTKWGLGVCSIKLNSGSKSALSAEQIASIEAKGYSII